MTGDQLVTPADLADACGVSEETIRRLCRAGKVPGAIKAGRSWVIPLQAAEAFAASYERYGRSDGPDHPLV